MTDTATTSSEARLPMRIIVGLTGASGSIYAERLIEVLAPMVERVYLVATPSGRQVADHELAIQPSGFSMRRFLEAKFDQEYPNLRHFDVDNLFAPIASGSAAATQMVILPCSMGTMSKIATGASTNLLERAADVMLKQKRSLVVCPRETPLNLIHLRNMTALAEAGATMMPAMPGFYNKPETLDDLVDFVVARILDFWQIDSDLVKRWNARLI